MRAMLRVLTVREKIKLTQEIKTIVSGQVLNPCKVSMKSYILGYIMILNVTPCKTC